MEAGLTERLCRLQRARLGTQDPGHDGAVAWRLVTQRAEPVSQSFGQGDGTHAAPRFRRGLSQASAPRGGQCRAGSRGKDEGPCPVPEPVDQRLAAHHESPAGPECLPEGAHDGLGRHARGGGDPPSLRTEDPEGVGLVEQQARAVTVAQDPQRREVRGVGVHAEVRLGDDPRPPFAAVTERSLDCPEVQVGNHGRSGPRQPDPVDERGVVEGVGDDQVVGPEQGGQETDVGGVPAGEEQRSLTAAPGRQRHLERHVLGALSGHEPRRTRPRSPRKDGLGGQSQVVVARERELALRERGGTPSEPMRGLQRREAHYGFNPANPGGDAALAQDE